jgi:hypothetical protein
MASAAEYSRGRRDESERGKKQQSQRGHNATPVARSLELKLPVLFIKFAFLIRQHSPTRVAPHSTQTAYTLALIMN